ncbi:MAG: type II toxin-antitoxin system RelE/ParE family toxin [Proteobacteria bacterium]|nr:type II toxin-antitoxin system RelE/ParE family toxin [Pseudomonadota bacterium]MYJ95621.1 type II toxin-antitoxin system RelE/ParE family toxin [Pseudomonadota bacterium]
MKDLDRLYEFGVEQFGLKQADRYFDGLIARFEIIARNPWLAPAVEHLLSGLRRSVYFSHSIYYLSDASGIQIIRILGREDVTQALR